MVTPENFSHSSFFDRCLSKTVRLKTNLAYPAYAVLPNVLLPLRSECLKTSNPGELNSLRSSFPWEPRQN